LLTGLTGLLIGLGCSLTALPRPAGQPTTTPAATPSATLRASQTPAVVVVTATPAPAEEAALPLSLDLDRLIDLEEQIFTRVYQQVSPAVVNITSRVLRRSFFFGAYPEEGTGSGFVIDKDGHIVTNYHVVRDARQIEVTLPDQSVYPAEVVGTDPYNDLAVINIDAPAEALHPIELGSSDDLQVGQPVIAIGNPFGLERTLTTGVISSLGRIIQAEDGRALGEMIQTDAAINPGNSGGPLLNVRGRMIGVNTAIRSPSGGSVGIGFAVPANTVRRVVPALIASGRYLHPWLGVDSYALTPRLAQVLNLPVDRGLLVGRVYEGSGAARAGIRGATREVIVGNNILLVGGDVITAINGHPMRTGEELTVFLENQTRVSETVQVTLIRDGKQLTVSVTLDELPVVARSGDRPQQGVRRVARSGDRPQQGGTVRRPATAGRRNARMDIIHHPTELVGLDDPVTAAVLEALYNFAPIRSSHSLIDVRVSDGAVELAGYVQSRMMKLAATDLALSVPGVREVRNRLVTDTDINIEVAAALAWDERTRLTSRQVVARTSQGIVHLAGRVPSAEVKAMVEEIVRGVDGVRDVINILSLCQHLPL
jgi:S1-C subfamily serine protease/osmotically-inducible protein OsmY